MRMHLLQAHVPSDAMELDDDALATWRAFLTAHAHVTRRISGDLVAVSGQMPIADDGCREAPPV